ncbi:MAG: DsbA family oxidoreductase [Rhodospirillales bacterium]|nr:DsbA family oxidoreductase [Rhodospirillales bacterium]
MRIDIVSDVICPWCFIGKRRLERALAAEPQGAIEVGWRPFQLNPDMPAEGMSRKDYLRAKFGDAGGGERYKHVIAAGLEEGIPFAFDRMERTPNTVRAHRLNRFAERAGRQDAVVEALFAAYFIHARDVGDVDVLTDVAAGCGLDAEAVRAYLVSDEDDDLIREEDAFARKIGIHGVPCFVVDRKFMVSGAQPPEVFAEVFQRVRESAAAQ